MQQRNWRCGRQPQQLIEHSLLVHKNPRDTYSQFRQQLAPRSSISTPHASQEWVSPQLVQAIRPYESFLIVATLKAQNPHRGGRQLFTPTLAFLAAVWSDDEETVDETGVGSGVAQFVQLHCP
jgi:hypothetical protein